MQKLSLSQPRRCFQPGTAKPGKAGEQQLDSRAALQGGLQALQQAAHISCLTSSAQVALSSALLMGRLCRLPGILHNIPCLSRCITTPYTPNEECDMPSLMGLRKSAGITGHQCEVCRLF